MRRVFVAALLIELAILLIGVTWIGPIEARVDRGEAASSMGGAPASTAPALAIASASTTPAGPVMVSIQQWSITPQVSTVSTGPVTFEVSNKGTITHEFVVMRTNTAAPDLKVGTYEGQSPRVNENTAGTVVGETGDMAAGTTKFVTINLEPGHYVFMCNLPAHYGLGMHTDFIVTGP
jgi:uncharacterized cupredoxin-like copper-binding protein